MWETNVKKYEEAILKQGIEQGRERGREEGREEGMTLEKRLILIDQMTIRFGASATTDRKINRVSSAAKLDGALRKVISAKNREEVMKCLD